MCKEKTGGYTQSLLTFQHWIEYRKQYFMKKKTSCYRLTDKDGRGQTYLVSMMLLDEAVSGSVRQVGRQVRVSHFFSASLQEPSGQSCLLYESKCQQDGGRTRDSVYRCVCERESMWESVCLCESLYAGVCVFSLCVYLCMREKESMEESVCAGVWVSNVWTINSIKSSIQTNHCV